MWDLEFSSLEHCDLARWLKEEVERGTKRSESANVAR
jgi:hypothetical protein